MSTEQTLRTVSNFSMNDADVILRLARAAPLANMEVAEQVAPVLARYVAYMQAVFAPPTPSDHDAAGEAGGP